MLYRIIMSILRFILAFVLVMYLVRMLSRWLLGVSVRRAGAAGGSNSSSDSDYRGLTDQEIEDAEYEELESGDK
jgi:hypothetical protein